MAGFLMEIRDGSKEEVKNAKMKNIGNGMRLFVKGILSFEKILRDSFVKKILYVFTQVFSLFCRRACFQNFFFLVTLLEPKKEGVDHHTL